MARLRFRSPLGDHGFADWLRALRGQGYSGVYLIREADTREIVYIGESHSGRLYETLTRHLWAWRGRGSGPSYYPEGVEIAVLIAETPLDDPVADQYALIEKHQPRDNVMDGHTLWERMFVRRRKGGAS